MRSIGLMMGGGLMMRGGLVGGGLVVGGGLGLRPARGAVGSAQKAMGSGQISHPCTQHSKQQQIKNNRTLMGSTVLSIGQGRSYMPALDGDLLSLTFTHESAST